MNLKEQVGRSIREARKARGFTQKEVAEKLGVTESAINRYENGKVNASLDTLFRLSEALSATVEISFKLK